MITGITTAPPTKVLVQLLGQFRSEELEFFFLIMWDVMNSQLRYPTQINKRI